MAQRRIQKVCCSPQITLEEMQELSRNPPCQCSVGPVGDDLYQWKGTITGPPGTSYEGGVFSLKIQFPPEYPFRAPTVQCLISKEGATDQLYASRISSEHFR